jgi:hypothetical protein
MLLSIPMRHCLEGSASLGTCGEGFSTATSIASESVRSPGLTT